MSILFLLFLIVGPVVGDNADHIEELGDQRSLDFLVQGRRRAERGKQVHFYEPGTEIRIQKYIEAEELVTLVSVIQKILAVPPNRSFCADECFDDEIIDAAPDLVKLAGHALCDEPFSQRRQAPLAAFTTLLGVLVSLERFGVLVDAVVGQMHEHVIEFVLASITDHQFIKVRDYVNSSRRIFCLFLKK